MRTIGLIGYGALGVQFEKMILGDSTKAVKFVYFDDIKHKENPGLVAPFYSYRDNPDVSIEYMVCLGYHHLKLKREILAELKLSGRKLYNLIHSTAYVSKTAKLGAGIVIYPKCNVDEEVVLEDGVLLNNSSVVSHNSFVGKSSYFGAAVVISGVVEIGECTFIGSGTVTANNLTIGSGCVIGAGSVITKSVPDNVKGVGNPFRFATINLQ